jgi:hypothetical protein
LLHQLSHTVLTSLFSLPLNLMRNPRANEHATTLNVACAQATFGFSVLFSIKAGSTNH